MPPRLKIEQNHSIEIAVARLSNRIGCGLMLKDLPRADFSDPLVNAMANYGINTLHADKPAQKLIDNSGLLKSFYDNAFTHKLPLKQNFRTTYGHLDVYLAFDPSTHTAWFVSEAQNRMALTNYHRDAVSLGLKTSGIMLLGSTAKLTTIGWQNIHDLLSDKFFSAHPAVQRVEVMSILSGVRWRPPCIGLGVTLLNIKELQEVRQSTATAMGTDGGEVES